MLPVIAETGGSGAIEDEKPESRCHFQKATWTTRLGKENISSRSSVRPEVSPSSLGSVGDGHSRKEGNAYGKVCPVCDEGQRTICRKINNRRRTSHSDTESVSKLFSMPVETNNSLLKSSFSLTSLRPCVTSDGADQGSRMPSRTDRPYHSLTKQPRSRGSQLEKEMWRRSWGSVTGQDEKPFWEGFQADYDYLMSQNILEKDASEKCYATPTAPLGWSFSELKDQFTQLCSWLSGIQDSINSREENVTDWKLRAERQGNLKRHRYRLENFNEESKRLMERFPQLETEISCYVRAVNEKWESVESLAIGLKISDGQRRKDDEWRSRIKSELRCLRKWLRELTTKLKPLSFQQTWTKSELELMAREHAVLHCDIEARSYVVSSIVKVCEKVDPASLGAARAIQRQYCEYRLRSLEWKCYIEDLQSSKSATATSESDGEPGAKKLKFDHGPGTRTNGREKTVNTASDSSGGKMLRETPSRGSGQSDPECSFGISADSSGKTGGWAVSEGVKESEQRVLTPPISGSTETSERTSRKASNIGSFQYKHPDTDTENSKPPREEESREGMCSEAPEAKDADSGSSDDDWTFVEARSNGRGSGDRMPAGTGVECSGNLGSEKPVKCLSAKNTGMESSSARRDSKDSIIQELVDRADEMVRCRSTNSLETSCRFRVRAKGSVSSEAGGTLDSYDASSENNAEDSDEADGASVATCRRSGSAEGILEDSPGCKASGVVMRSGSRQKKVRPSSMSCVPSCLGRRMTEAETQLSVSESALNQVSWKDFSFAANGRDRRGLRPEENGGGSGSLRRPRRTRTRKRNAASRRNDPLVECGPSEGCEAPQPTGVRGLVKSGSFSGTIPRPSDGVHGQGKCSDSGSGTETDEDGRRPVLPVFKLGPGGGEVTVAGERGKMVGDEPISLNSDLVDWDNFQEKYQSEAYSEEPPDPDLVKNVLEFGEDYSKYIDSQSECEEPKKTYRRSHMQEELSSWEETLREPDVPAAISGDVVVAGEKFLCCREGGEDLDADGLNEQLGTLEGLLGVQARHYPNHGYLLKEKMISLRNELRSLANKVGEVETVVTTRAELDSKIEQMRSELDNVREVKRRLRQVNCSVHRFLLDTGQSAFPLKDDVSDLYQAWNRTFDRVSTKLCTLQRISESWREFEDLLTQFQCTLRSDLETLNTLDSALCDASCRDVALSVRDVARVLFDKESSAKNQFSPGNPEAVVPQQQQQQSPMLASLSTEGSFSDSGISDSGSELEMSEREKKLARLKRLQKYLDGILTPGSPELADMSVRIEQAELELKRLQKKCRDLFQRSAPAGEAAATAEFRPLPPLLGKASSERKSSAEGVRADVVGFCSDVDDDDDDDDDPRPGRSWLWRVFRAAVPFPLAVVALICVAYLLEPRCCDTVNHLGASFAQQLRYNRNPPPT